MLMREDHAGGEGSCWWERIMLVEKDHVGGEGLCWFCKMMSNAKYGFSHKKMTFSQSGPLCVRSQQIAANYMSGRPRPENQSSQIEKQAYVEMIGEK